MIMDSFREGDDGATAAGDTLRHSSEVGDSGVDPVPQGDSVQLSTREGLQRPSNATGPGTAGGVAFERFNELVRKALADSAVALSFTTF
mmetsp:Transcript_10077/g.29766  ORF Transcript_10077/g.29766 Transcript_10077/m.29766 type:complete len:89 (-) Transcript_10077:120-386(-)